MKVADLFEYARDRLYQERPNSVAIDRVTGQEFSVNMNDCKRDIGLYDPDEPAVIAIKGRMHYVVNVEGDDRLIVQRALPELMEGYSELTD